nr:MAG TPA: hypothetical protein [Caudoviricetes sp.]DAM98719.1 MAG TPA: hypothetical protein [Caudoviricetes sp.]DAP53086.1 MAG TPA: hypothetical protein [Caudoviricetes sp.]
MRRVIALLTRTTGSWIPLYLIVFYQTEKSSCIISH